MAGGCVLTHQWFRGCELLGLQHEVNEGLEDVEYWIAAGERGFCGKKINYTTLLYRRQENSRAYVLKHINQTFRGMQEKIKEMHAPIYRGEFPKMACGCGDKATVAPNVDPIVRSAQNQNIAKITELKNYPDNETEWVTYQGKKRGSFSILVRGPKNLPSSYMILGTGHAFQIHRNHHEFFSQRQHMGFRVNQPDPKKQADPLPVEIKQPEIEVVPLPKPELSTLVRLDSIGGQTREANIQLSNEVIIEPDPPANYSSVMTAELSLPVSDLGLSNTLTDLLAADDWTVQKLAETTVYRLTRYSGIGNKRAQAIIDKATELIVSQ